MLSDRDRTIIAPHIRPRSRAEYTNYKTREAHAAAVRRLGKQILVRMLIHTHTHSHVRRPGQARPRNWYKHIYVHTYIYTLTRASSKGLFDI